MTDIQPNAKGKIRRAQKRLRRHIINLRNADQLTAGQRNQLFARILEDLVRINMHLIGEEDES